MTRTQELKIPIRAFLRANYSEQNLCDALAHAKDGKWSAYSCNCLIGLPSARHALNTAHMFCGLHYTAAKDIPGANEAESAFISLGLYSATGAGAGSDPIRRRILIPMLRAELRRRSREPQHAPAVAECEVASV